MAGKTKMDLRRVVYWANNGRGGEIESMAEAAGFDVAVAGYERARPYREVWFYRDGDVVGMIHEFTDEAFLFLWTPEARASQWRQTLWALRHPRKWWASLPRLDPERFTEDDVGRIFARPVESSRGE